MNAIFESSTWTNTNSALGSYRAFVKYMVVKEGREPEDPPSQDDCFAGLSRDVKVRHGGRSLRSEYPLVSRWLKACDKRMEHAPTAALRWNALTTRALVCDS